MHRPFRVATICPCADTTGLRAGSGTNRSRPMVGCNAGFTAINQRAGFTGLDPQRRRLYGFFRSGPNASRRFRVQAVRPAASESA